ncbi:MAG TPA: DNA primase [Candidatus Saccharimonadales bacterium]|nr:DNA primase [Candidatus Saccharimonadales bacterium]
MDAVEEVKTRLSIEDVIGEYVQLKRAGRNWRGLSPFTAEKTPSLMVSPEKQIWHDFSSGKGGNMFSFVMEMEGLEFKGALELLARKAGIDIEQFRGQGQRGGPNKERLYELLELSAKFYQVQFSKNKTALRYVLTKRQFTKATALEWRLGYSPNNGSALVSFAKSKGFTEAEIKQAGLSSRSYRGGVQDMFRGRLMIPLQDPQGRVIGFTARLLEDMHQDGPGASAPKYINTPQTVLYDKSRHIYGLHLAKESIRKSQFAVLVEGNLDVIASHQAGVQQVVATAGTALTEPHLKALSRFTGDIRLCFDADKAGLAATERAIPIASRVKVSLSIITIPSGKDPDELIQKDASKWQEIIQKHEYALDWLMERYKKLLNITSAEGKRQYSDILLPVVRGLADPVEQDHYLNSIASTIQVSVEALKSKLKQTKSADEPTRQRRMKTEPKLLAREMIENIKTQDHFLSLMLLRPGLRQYLAVMESDMLYSEEAREVMKFLKQNPDFSGKDEELKKVQNLVEYAKILALQYEELYQGLELTELHYEAARLQARLVEQFVKKQKQSVATELETAGEAATRDLLERAKQYDLLLKQVQGARLNEPQETS